MTPYPDIGMHMDINTDMDVDADIDMEADMDMDTDISDMLECAPQPQARLSGRPRYGYKYLG